ncbi:hypothetical protein M9Y10_017737 [Tritrichomonas musculus]|uniref:Guanylate cyclase domain-containing protein n=1 Tax=Tritrichomonas musculus TaxID=1915356 RepID=A0ABR2HW29_9EUKA
MKIKRNVKSKLLEKTPLEKLFHNLRTFFMLTNRSVLLPYPFYQFLEYFRLFEFLFSLLLTDMAEIWDTNAPFRNIFHLAQIFWRFSADVDTKSGLTASFIVILVLFFVLEATVFGIFINFMRTSVITQTASFITCLFQEIIFQILFSWISSQMATVISLIATDSSFRNGFEYAQLAIYFLLFVYFIFFSFHLSNNDAAYMKGRSVCWSYKTQRIYIFTTLINLFLTRLVEMLPKLPSLIFAIINIAAIICYVVYLFIFLPYIDLKFNTLHISCSISFTVGFIIQLLSRYVIRIDSIFVLIVVIILSIVLILIVNKVNEDRRRNAIETLKAVSSNEILFEEAFKTKRSFLLSIRFGFFSGNIYVFSWQPFLNAIDIWPNDRDIWIQWIRFTIIYPDQSRRLEQIMNEFREKGFKDLSTKYIISQVKFIQNSRNKHMTRDLKQDLNVIDEEIFNIKTIVITFWNEISGGSLNSNSTYNIASKLKQLLDKVNTQYLRLLSLYPNNYPIASKYSEFMYNIVSDPAEGQFWDNRSKVLKNKIQQVLTDATQEYGFSFFPFIPRNLQGFSDGNMANSPNDSLKQRRGSAGRHRSPQMAGSSLLIAAEEGDENAPIAGESNNDDNQGNQANNLNSKLVESNQINDSSTALNYTGEDEDTSLTPSHFRKLGLTAKVPFITNLIIISVIFFLVAFICVPFVPPIMIVATLEPYRRQFEVLKSVCDIRTSLMKEPFYMFFHSLMTMNRDIVAGFNPYQNSTLNNEIIKLNEKVQEFQKSLGNVIDHNSQSGKYINTTLIEFRIFNATFNSTFLEGLNSMVGAVLHHDDPLAIYFEKPWFQYIFNNMDRMENSLASLSRILCNDMNEHRDDSISTISIILYIFIGLEVILIPVFIGFAVHIRKNWNYIINTINSIPRVAIQKVIQKYSNENTKSKNDNEHKNFKSEFRYQLSLVQMVSSRDTSGGLPIKSIIIIFIVIFIISIACVIAVIQIMNITKRDLTNVPMQYYTGTDGIYAIFKLITVFLIKGYVDLKNAEPVLAQISPSPLNTSSFGIFNQNYIYRGINYISMQMANTLDQVIFGSTDEPEKGILYSTPEVLDLLTQSNGNPYGDGDTIEELDIQKFPHFVGFELFYETNLKFVEAIISDPTFNSIYEFLVTQKFDLTTIFTSVKLGTFSLVPNFLEVYVHRTDELFNNSMDEINLILFLLGAGLFVVGILAIAWLNVMINNVKKTVQFSLSLLSMVDPNYVQEMQNVMNLFYGKTSGTVQTNQTLQRTFNEVESLVPECPLELNNQMHIVSINEKLIDMWELDPEQLTGTHISLILTFNDEDVLEKLIQQANGQSHPKEPRYYETSITLNASKKVINVSFTSHYVPKNKETKLVLMFGKTFDSEKNDLNIKEIEKKNNEIKILSVPEGLRNKIDVENDRNSFTSHYLIFAAVEILNMNEFALNHSPKEVRFYFKKFEGQIKEMCQNHNIDATYLKSVGNTFIVGFNFIQQNTNYYKSAQESYEFMKSLDSFANSNNYQIRTCLTSTKSATSLLLSQNTLKFDVYSEEIQAMMIMVKSGQKGQLLFPAKMKDFMPPNLSAEAEEAEIIQYNRESDWGYKINFALN